MKTFILASASPRRSAILSQLKVPFRIEPSRFAEKPDGLDPEDRPLRFAKEKALEVSRRFPGEYVLGFDTLVFFGSRPLGKPANRDEALEMLSLLNGNTHKVITGAALACSNAIVDSGKEETFVTFRRLSRKALEDYADSREPMDKAGAYAIQGLGARLVQSIEGCYYNVVGLPVAKTLSIIERLGE